MFFQVELWALQILHLFGTGDEPGGGKSFVLLTKTESVIEPHEDEKLDQYHRKDGAQYYISGIVEFTKNVHQDHDAEDGDRVALKDPLQELHPAIDAPQGILQPPHSAADPDQSEGHQRAPVIGDDHARAATQLRYQQKGEKDNGNVQQKQGILCDFTFHGL